MKLFILGAGNAANVIIDNMYEEVESFFIFDINQEKQKNIVSKFDKAQEATIDQIKDSDFVIECASGEAVKQIYKEVLHNNKNFIVLSSGAFSDKKFRSDFIKLQKQSTSQVIIPSGAIGGLDLITAIKTTINEIEIVTTKSPKSLGMDGLIAPEVVFQGTSVEAIKKYPKNINVAVTLSLAIESFEKVKVKIVADPKAETNSHEIKVKSEIGDYSFTIKNHKSNNPGTSLLAPLSIVGLLRNQKSNFKVGI
jgi:aspartate dehydrogenase